MNQEKIKKEIFKEICRIKNYPEIKPSYTSIGPIPIRPNNRRLYSYPRVVKLIIDYLAPIINKSGVDLIAGGETAGIPLAMALSLKTNIPFIYVRKEAKIKGPVSQGEIEGDFKTGDKAVLVEDVMGFGTTKLMFIKKLAEVGVKVTDIVIIMKTNDPHSSEFDQAVKENKIKVHPVFSWEELTKVQVAAKKIPQTLAHLVLDYVINPQSWRNNDQKWHQYCQVLKKINIEIPDFLKKYE